MAQLKTRSIWIVWLISSLLAVAYFSYSLVYSNDKSLFMPGPLSAGHHQLTEKCEVCHTDAFGGDKDSSEVLQAACINCHGDERKKPLDSHPLAKFKDPRNADRLQKIDALHCVTCHTEHRQEITLKDGLTQPLDVCFHCHQDVAEDRPSHEGMAFDTCKDSGCHNYHNNRALYTKFLLKNIGKPDVVEEATVPAREFASVLDEIIDYPREQYPVKPLTVVDADAPDSAPASADVLRDWHESSHARAGVNCTACHVMPNSEDNDSATTTQWQDKPTTEMCGRCHGLEVKRYNKGKHGMREVAGLPPLTPAQARLPMQEKQQHKTMGCNSCHGGHRMDTQSAAVDACLGCHADEHSLAYKNSRHYALWQAELRGDGAPNSGASCATCHMARINFDVNDWMSRILVDHNQSANLSPNSKMIRSACQHCHGLAFSLDSLADSTLIRRNFSGRPGTHVTSMTMAKEDMERRKAKRGTEDEDSMFGF